MTDWPPEGKSNDRIAAWTRSHHIKGHRLFVIGVISTLALVVSPGFSNAQQVGTECFVAESSAWSSDSGDLRIIQGTEAVHEFRFQDADSLFRLATQDPATEAEAWYMLAKLNLHDGVDLPANASRFIRRAMELEPGNIRFIEERLRQVNSGKLFFTSSDADTPFWASRILGIDSTDVTAHATLGKDFLGQYYRYDGLMDTNANDVLAEMRDNALAMARYHLETALDIDPCHRPAYDSLIRLHFSTGSFDLASVVAVLMQDYFPTERQTWLYSAASAYFAGQPSESESLFEYAFSLMDFEEMSAFRQQAYFLDNEQRMAANQNRNYLRDFWTARKPRYLTDVNERLIAHYARLVYSDIFYPYWRAYIDDEWQITPGEIVLRWGVPSGSFTYTDSRSRFLTLTFQNGSVRFTDWTRNGEYFVIDTAPIPKADEPLAPGSDVTAARDQIYFTPEAYGNDGPARVVDIPYLVSVLKPEGVSSVRRADVIVSLGIAMTASESNSATLGRVLDETNLAGLDQIFLTLGTFLIDSAYDVAAEKRQTFYGLPENGLMSTSGGALWTTTHTLSASPGDYRVSVEFETESKNVIGATSAQISVPSFSSDSLMLSDLVLAYSVDESTDPDAGATNILKRNGLDIQLAPWGVFSTIQPIYVYFEMYNLMQDPTGSTRVEFEVALVPIQSAGGILGFFDRVLGGNEEGVAVASTYSGSTSRDGQYVIIDASEQLAGEYGLVVRVRDLHAGTERLIQRTIFLEDAQ